MKIFFKKISDFICINKSCTCNIIFITGATASGKTLISILLANKFNGVIINADSMQIYKEMQIISSRPSLKEEKKAEHRMFGYISIFENYSVGHWLNQVCIEIIDVLKNGKIPIIVGGTGLYFSALLNGISFIPDIDKDVKKFWRNKKIFYNNEYLYKQLMKVDLFLAKRLKVNDKQRVIRGLEVYYSTGRTLSDWQQNEPLKKFLPKIEGLNLHKFKLQPEREYLYNSINKRFDRMIKLGLIEEVKKIMLLGLSTKMIAFKAIGIKQINEALIGNISFQDAIKKSKTETRRYAKRQITWQNNNLIMYNAITEKKIEEILSAISSKIFFYS